MLEYITAIGISLTSLHFPNHDQNQFNPGIHVEVKDARAGVYLNSRDRITAYVGYSLPLYRSETLRIGALAALGSGYGSPIIGGLEFMVGQHFTMLAVPGIPGYSSTIVGFALRSPIK